MSSRNGILRTSDRRERRSGCWRLNQLLREHGFDDFAEAQYAAFYADTMGRPSLPPGIYFRLLLIGYFEGIDSERGIAWRAGDSLALRDFLGIGLETASLDHSTISRTRRLIDVESHRAVFTWILQCPEYGRPGEGQDDRDRCDDAGGERGAAEHRPARQRRKLRGVSDDARQGLGHDDWTHRHDPNAKITKMKDGRTHLAHKAEHAIDLETGAIIGVTGQGADEGDTATIQETLPEASRQTTAPPARRIARATVCASVREGWAPASPRARTRLFGVDTPAASKAAL